MFNTSAGGASLLAQRSQTNLLPASSLLLPSPGRPHQPPRWSPGCRPCPARLLHGAVLQSELLKAPSVLSLPCRASTVLRIKPISPPAFGHSVTYPWPLGLLRVLATQREVLGPAASVAVGLLGKQNPSSSRDLLGQNPHCHR